LIISQIETLIQNNKLNQQTNSKLSSMYHSCMQLRELITELLDYRKHQLGHLKLQVTRGNIVGFLKDNYLLFSDYASRESISLEFTSSHDDIEMWYDSKQIQKVINNLLFNAIKYTPKGGKISINLSKDINKVNISIADNGKGIPEKDLTKIFDIFYQSDNSVNTANGISGSGIGLALVKSIVKMHHGEISVNSKINEGSIFTFTLPLGDELYSETEKGPSISQEESPTLLNDKKPIVLKDTHESQTTEEEDEAFEENISDKPNMMIVEDNTAIRNIIREILSPFYTIHDMPDAESALSEIEGIMPDIVITDVMMPGMNGKELCRKLKTNPATSHIPVILLTAQTAVEQYIEGFQTGADDYITKPFNARLLISRCNNLVNSRILLQEKFSHRPETNVQMLATNKLDKEILDKAISIIEENIGNAEFNMNTFAREMGMARTNLFAKIKAITGQTPNDFITNIRLKRGAHLLRNNPELNITEIAEKLGFSSARYFSKCFKDLYNISPLSYRKDKTEEQQPAE
ncbi:MAG: ATP-binding protein, partial [Phocaeicola sp.]